MHTLKISNYRCFYREQAARLAPLTILVGENSTGKSSLLAIIRIMLSVASLTRHASFNDPEFPLGGFNDIVSSSSLEDHAAPQFSASMIYHSNVIPKSDEEFLLKVVFKNYMNAPGIFKVTIANLSKNIFLHLHLKNEDFIEVSVEANSRSLTKIGEIKVAKDLGVHLLSKDHFFLLQRVLMILENERPPNPSSTSPDNRAVSLSPNEQDLIRSLIEVHQQKVSQQIQFKTIAPTRSKPKRVYEQTGINVDHEGSHAPELLAGLTGFQNYWSKLKQNLNRFGNDSGMFNDFGVKFLDKTQNSAFKIQFRTSTQEQGSGSKHWRNVIDLGYGVSQVLPILTDLYTRLDEQVVLMQQPEIHLHPRAQAEFGSILCEIASKERMLLVETHSDYLLDRVRINIRKDVGNIRADDVSILFFRRHGEEATIHSMRLDDYGNIVDAPDEYMDFFMKEGNELLGLA